MEVIDLRDVPRRSCVSVLCKILIAAPIATGIMLGSRSILRHGPEAISQAHAEPVRALPDMVTKADLRSLPVPALPQLPERTLASAPVEPRIDKIVGVTFDGKSFATADGRIFQLEGIKLPSEAGRCRRIDGVEVTCLERIAARIEVLGRSQAIRCDITEQGLRRTGKCFAGKSDVASDLARAGLVQAGERDASPVLQMVKSVSLESNHR